MAASAMEGAGAAVTVIGAVAATVVPRDDVTVPALNVAAPSSEDLTVRAIVQLPSAPIVPPLKENDVAPEVVISVPPQELAGVVDVVVNPAGKGLLNVSPVAGTNDPVLSNCKVSVLVRPCTTVVGLKTAVMVGIGAAVTVNDGLTAAAFPREVVRADEVAPNAPSTVLSTVRTTPQVPDAATVPPE